MNAYIAFGIFAALAIAACVFVFTAYRKGLSDGLEINKHNRLKETVAVQKKAVKDAGEIDDKSIAEQLKKMRDF